MSEAFWQHYDQLAKDHQKGEVKNRIAANIPVRDDEVSFARFQQSQRDAAQRRQDTFERNDGLSYIDDLEGAWRSDGYRSVITKSGTVESEPDMSEESDEGVKHKRFFDKRYRKEYERRGLDREDGLTYEEQLEQAWRIR